MRISRSLIAVASILALFPLKALAKDEPCTSGIDCLCNRISDPSDPIFDPQALFCEDFEDPGMLTTDSRGTWHQKYGVGTSGCTVDKTDGNNFRTGFYPGSSAISASVDCAAILSEGSCGVPGESDCVFQGGQVLGHRMRPGRTGGILGTANFPKTRRFGLTMAIKWTNNYQVPGSCSECGPANKMNEFGNGLHPLMGATLSTAQRNHPFDGGVLRSSGPEPVMALGSGRSPRDNSHVYFSPDPSRYSWGSDNTVGQWGCFQMHWDNWGTSNTTFRYWFNGTQIISGTVSTANLQNGVDPSGVGSLWWNNYYNGDSSTGYPAAANVAYRLEDNVVITGGAEPVSCDAIGFGSIAASPSDPPPPPPPPAPAPAPSDPPAAAPPAPPVLLATTPAPGGSTPGTTFTNGGPLSIVAAANGSSVSVSASRADGTGPYQFLVDCRNDGNWDGIIDTPNPAGQYTCSFGASGTYGIRVWSWDRTTGVTDEVTFTFNTN